MMLLDFSIDIKNGNWRHWKALGYRGYSWDFIPVHPAGSCIVAFKVRSVLICKYPSRWRWVDI